MSLPRRPASVLVAVLLLVGACVPSPVGRPSRVPGTATTAPSATVIPTPAGPTPSPSFVRPTPTPTPTFLAYVVQPGDTLSSIARSFSTTARSIAFWNRARYPSLDPDSAAYAPDRIRVGWSLELIPGAEIDELDLPGATASPSSTPSSTPFGSPDASSSAPAAAA